ncbi:energy-coupling factor ABC transporter ATP-binding protein [Demetria terragena]|uniref:energy-coupling factor ABC transporter ATP-binding protein n=1 Tax=Demetria terragena TaxID=63959 RepID=UPI00037594A1|nr:ABC transporter ATP-binding protein [Demetria terragena]
MIELDAVSHRLGERAVLRDVSLQLDEDRIGVIGANGSGKSTLARTFNALVVPDEGEVRVNGLDVRKRARDVRRQVGFMFTDAGSQILMPTVAEDIQLSLRDLPMSKAQKDARSREVLDRFGLQDHADHPAQLLSGGQKQLLAFASVLVRDPQILVCDEPSTLLDLANVLHLQHTLADLPMQVILLTHHLELLDDFDRVVVLDEGQVVADGKPAHAVTFYRDLMASRT